MAEPMDTVESFNPQTNLWTEISSLNHARHGTQAIVSGDGVFITGGSPKQGGGSQRNMEAFNSSIPAGISISEGDLEFSLNELVIDSFSTAKEVALEHASGNQGVVITQVELQGNDASSFAITDVPNLPALIPVDGAKSLSIRALNAIHNDFTFLVVSYANGQQVQLPVRFENTGNGESQENLIVNDSFESEILTKNLRLLSSTEGWTTNSRVELWRTGFFGVNSQDGSNYVELDVNSKVVDLLTQEVNTVSGQRYQLSLYTRNRPGTSGASNIVEVHWNGDLIEAITPKDNWEQTTIEVVGSGFDRLSIGEPESANDGRGSHLDNVSLRTIDSSVEPMPKPEPQPEPITISNLSLNKTAQQSSTSHNGAAERAVDGSTNGIWRNRSVTHTSNSFQPWWEVDLAAQSSIKEVVLHNRTDSCCSSRLSNFYVMVSDTPFENRSLAELLNDSQVARSFHSSLSSSSLAIPLNASGRYVRVQLQGTNPLSLAEVQVMGVSQ